MEQALQTVELLELILSHLSMRDLLAAQRVNYLWNEVISTSRHAQRTKFLLPDNSIAVPACGYAETNPLYLQRFIQQACFHVMEQLNPKMAFMGMDRFVLKTVENFPHPEASWRKMLLFQPPVPQALIRPMSAHYDEGCSIIEGKDGVVTMGDVVEFFRGKAGEGQKAIDLLVLTVTRKVVWTVTPVVGEI